MSGNGHVSQCPLLWAYKQCPLLLLWAITSPHDVCLMHVILILAWKDQVHSPCLTKILLSFD